MHEEHPADGLVEADVEGCGLDFRVLRHRLALVEDDGRIGGRTGDRRLGLGERRAARRDQRGQAGRGDKERGVLEKLGALHDRSFDFIDRKKLL
ncbi:MAG TPA: hypothetical protein VE891_06825 [Allosphingosinicella sp.]|nr:hypothetical protein [Allosphingosinicella sp.]